MWLARNVSLPTDGFIQAYDWLSPTRLIAVVRNSRKFRLLSLDIGGNPQKPVITDLKRSVEWPEYNFQIVSPDRKWLLYRGAGRKGGNTSVFSLHSDQRIYFPEDSLAQIPAPWQTNPVWLNDSQRWVQIVRQEDALYSLVRDVRQLHHTKTVRLGRPMEFATYWDSWGLQLLGALPDGRILGIGFRTLGRMARDYDKGLTLFDFDPFAGEPSLRHFRISLLVGDISAIAYSTARQRLAFFTEETPKKRRAEGGIRNHVLRVGDLRNTDNQAATPRLTLTGEYSPSHLRWSPDGNRLAYFREGALWIAS